MNGERDSSQVSLEFLFRKICLVQLHHQASPSKQGTSKIYHSRVSATMILLPLLQYTNYFGLCWLYLARFQCNHAEDKGHLSQVHYRKRSMALFVSRLVGTQHADKNYV